MKNIFTTCLVLLLSNLVQAQWEFSTGYAVNRNLCDGMPIHAAYEIKLKSRFFTKSQIGYKRLKYYNDFVGATLKTNILEFHQTFSYELIRHKKFIFKPNIGFNYRFYKWKGKMEPPYNTIPGRAWVIGIRNNKRFILDNYTPERIERTYEVNNVGFSFQLQTQYRLKERLWLHITPFIEPDYDASQNTGGCYIGLIFKKDE